MPSGIYIETSIISYLAARPSKDFLVAAHQSITATWWTTRREHFDLYCSQLVINECSAGDPDAARKRLDRLTDIAVLELTEDCLRLAKVMTTTGPVPKNAFEDALHISIATLHGLEYLLTWNCKHIANAEIRPHLERICRAHGFEAPIICTPEELMGA